jgi:hypothetical protein
MDIQKQAQQLRAQYPKQTICVVGNEIRRYSTRMQKYGPRDGNVGQMTRSRRVYVLEAKY